ncbi:hypothetical protein K450DRAFT_167996 [Umbelopsis ramanniana AG]|uniref:NADH:flavin oxidoreductase/NADH oxidase N-terminal domain-containing protein n=1 Tax=Umbelopsis ramanniana AG TaxID=1314678 RepID=A0AAD5EKG8_UMBRA|nr:uncharacterized protein K450DRAFT_167996 [Umbelopsis ramanniana AG]KAI8584636.1 hypothetical protein K450DRAFT_167996 [Umbelopsis ramanniana AG]
MTTSKLFSPTRVGNNVLRHRVVLAPLTRYRAATNHVPSDLQVEYYKQRAGSGGGLLITEATLISPMAGGYPGSPGIFTQEQVEGWKKVTTAVHAQGAVIFIQLWHAGRATNKALLPNNASPVSASAIAVVGVVESLFSEPYEVPRPLEEDEIPAIIQEFVIASVNAIEAGFDGVEIQAANGYLIDQFINSKSNIRTDKYGGSIESRNRLALEVVHAIEQAIGLERTAIRLSPWGASQNMGDDTPLETWGYLTQQLQDEHLNLAYLHFVEPRPLMFRTFSSFRQPNIVHQIWKSAFISAGGHGDKREKALKIADETDNLLAFGRIFISNPDLPHRLQENLPLNLYNRATFYTQGAEGYIDYPEWEESRDAGMNEIP